MVPSLTCQLKWPRTSLPAQLASARAGTIARSQPQIERLDKEEGGEIMTVEAEEAAKVAVVAAVAATKTNDGSTALTQKTTLPHSPTKR